MHSTDIVWDVAHRSPFAVLAGRADLIPLIDAAGWRVLTQQLALVCSNRSRLQPDASAHESACTRAAAAVITARHPDFYLLGGRAEPIFFLNTLQPRTDPMRRLTTAALAAALLAAPALAQPKLRDGANGQIDTAISSQATAQITVENRLGPGVVVFALYLSASADPSWGVDRLGDQILRPGETLRTIVYGDCARQDVRIFVLHEDARGRWPTGEIIRRMINVCGGLRLSPDLAWRVEFPT